MNEKEYPSVYDDETVIVIKSKDDMKRLGLVYPDEAYEMMQSPWGYMINVIDALNIIRENTIGIMDKGNIMNIVRGIRVMPHNQELNKPQTIKIVSCLSINGKKVPITLYEERGMCGDSPESVIVRYNTFFRLLCDEDITIDDLMACEEELGEEWVSNLIHNFKNREEIYTERIELFDTLLTTHRKRMSRLKKDWIRRHANK